MSGPIPALTVTASAVVEFGQLDTDIIVELDDRPFGFNFGKTSFLAGQSAYLCVYLPPGFYVQSTLISAGQLTFIANSSRTFFREVISFLNTDTAQLSHPCDGNFVYVWDGNPPFTGADIRLVTPRKITLPPRGLDPNTGYPVPRFIVGGAFFSYESQFALYRISAVPIGAYNVHCLFVCQRDAP
jgi:hypothetical protein